MENVIEFYHPPSLLKRKTVGNESSDVVPGALVSVTVSECNESDDFVPAAVTLNNALAQSESIESVVIIVRKRNGRQNISSNLINPAEVLLLLKRTEHDFISAFDYHDDDDESTPPPQVTA